MKTALFSFFFLTIVSYILYSQFDDNIFPEYISSFRPQSRENSTQTHLEDEQIDLKKFLKSRFNFASFDVGAKVLESNPEATGASRILNEDRDKYMLNPCKAKKRVTIELSEEIYVDSIALANYEFYSSMVKEFRVNASQQYPCRQPRCRWEDLGTYTAQNTRELQVFTLTKPSWARYLTLEFLSHYGDEFYCTLSVFRAHGSSLLDDLKEEIASSTKEVVEFQHIIRTSYPTLSVDKLRSAYGGEGKWTSVLETLSNIASTKTETAALAKDGGSRIQALLTRTLATDPASPPSDSTQSQPQPSQPAEQQQSEAPARDEQASQQQQKEEKEEKGQTLDDQRTAQVEPPVALEEVTASNETKVVAANEDVMHPPETTNDDSQPITSDSQRAENTTEHAAIREIDPNPVGPLAGGLTAAAGEDHDPLEVLVVKPPLQNQTEQNEEIDQTENAAAPTNNGTAHVEEQHHQDTVPISIVDDTPNASAVPLEKEEPLSTADLAADLPQPPTDATVPTEIPPEESAAPLQTNSPETAEPQPTVQGSNATDGEPSPRAEQAINQTVVEQSDVRPAQEPLVNSSDTTPRETAEPTPIVITDDLLGPLPNLTAADSTLDLHSPLDLHLDTDVKVDLDIPLTVSGAQINAPTGGPELDPIGTNSPPPAAAAAPSPGPTASSDIVEPSTAPSTASQSSPDEPSEPVAVEQPAQPSASATAAAATSPASTGASGSASASGGGVDQLAELEQFLIRTKREGGELDFAHIPRAVSLYLMEIVAEMSEEDSAESSYNFNRESIFKILSNKIKKLEKSQSVLVRLLEEMNMQYARFFGEMGTVLDQHGREQNELATAVLNLARRQENETAVLEAALVNVSSDLQSNAAVYKSALESNDLRLRVFARNVTSALQSQQRALDGMRQDMIFYTTLASFTAVVMSFVLQRLISWIPGPAAAPFAAGKKSSPIQSTPPLSPASEAASPPNHFLGTPNNVAPGVTKTRSMIEPAHDRQPLVPSAHSFVVAEGAPVYDSEPELAQLGPRAGSPAGQEMELSSPSWKDQEGLTSPHTDPDSRLSLFGNQPERMWPSVHTVQK